MRVQAAMVWVAATVAGCGGSSDGGAKADVQGYADTAQAISGAASSYATAGGATADVPSCQAAHGAYDAQVRPMVDRMSAMSGGMDGEMQMMGHAADADMTCGADAMHAELARHDVAACASADMAANHAEVARHASAMEAWAEHQRMRADEMGGMMGMGGMGGGPTAPTCHRNDDGTFTLGP